MCEHRSVIKILEMNGDQFSLNITGRGVLGRRCTVQGCVRETPKYYHISSVNSCVIGGK